MLFYLLQDTGYSNSKNYFLLISKNGKLPNDLEVVDEHDLLSKLIETSASKDKPILVNNSENNTIGVISQSRLLKAVIEGGDGE